MLVSIFVLTILLVVLVQFFGGIQSIWTSEEQRVEDFQGGRAALNEISKDLGPVLAPSLTFVQWQRVPNLPSTQFVQDPPLPVQLLSGTDSLFWQAPQQITSQGNLAILGYFVDTRRELVRYCVQPDNSLNSPASVLPQDAYTLGLLSVYPFYPPLDPSRHLVQIHEQVAWLNQKMDGSPLPAAYFAPEYTGGLNAYGLPNTPSKIAAKVMDGVFGFWVRCLDVDGNGIPWLNDASYPTSSRYDSAYPGTMNQLPDSVEITLAVLDSRTMHRISSLNLGSVVAPTPASSSQADYQTAINGLLYKMQTAHVPPPRIFTTRIYLRNSGY